MISLEKNERIEDLQCGELKIIQNKSLYTFTSDSVILANFIKLNKNDRVLEIGGGCGVISILLSEKTNCKNFCIFELQPLMAKLCDKNIKLNNLNDKISLVCDDIKNFEKYMTNECMDVVFSNPPYMKCDSENANNVRDIARHDSKLSIQDLCSCVKKLLKFGGAFYVIYSADRTCELVCELIENNLQPKEMFFTENGKGKVSRVVIKAVKGGKSGVKVYPNLITNDVEGKYLEKLQTKNFK